MPEFKSVDWDKAECKDLHTDLFFKVEEERNETAYIYINAVRSFCGRCPIQKECLGYAFAHEDFGVWGGLTSVERTAIAQPRKYPVQLKRAALSLKMYGITMEEVRQIYEHSFDVGSVAKRFTDRRKDGASRNR